jgi:DNA mismatch repair protein MutL
MTEIQKLDAETQARIAAGEAVTRPEDVVKELLENALDAGAARIEIRVENGGIDRARVRDDGCGMAAEDARFAFERHTTSKLDGAEGVGRVKTLGFRGEALPSIAAVADVTLTTKPEGGEATRVIVEDGETETRPAGHGVGTTVMVTDLFERVPARRKSLADPATEFARVSDLVTRYALVRPDVSFRLEHGDRTVLTTPGSGDFADALLGAYDRTVAGQSEAVAGQRESGAGEIAVHGRVVHPGETRARPSHVHVAVNGRALADSTVRDAVVEGYGSLLPEGRYPIAAIAVDLPAEAVDANVHPRKEEVGFTDADAVADAVSTAVRAALSTADLARTAEMAFDPESSLSPVERDSAFGEVSVIGQFREAYLLCEADEDLLVVDQHAAHERVNYERLRESVGEAVPTRELDPPATLSLSPGAAATLEANREAVAGLGYEVSAFGGDTYRVAAVPAPLGRAVAPESLREVLDRLGAGDDPVDRREELLKDLACHPSLKAGEALDAETAGDLLERLGACEQPYACPHGRPTVLSIDERTLVSGFERGRRRLG